jgi:hypothetical protein
MSVYYTAGGRFANPVLPIQRFGVARTVTGFFDEAR